MVLTFDPVLVVEDAVEDNVVYLGKMWQGVHRCFGSDVCSSKFILDNRGCLCVFVYLSPYFICSRTRFGMDRGLCPFVGIWYF